MDIAPIQAAADILLDADRDPGQLLAAAQALREGLAALAQWDELAPGNAVETGLPDGVAIAPTDAARCILDFQRTSTFMRGAVAAIEAVSRRTPGPIDVLYAGCGPLAPLAVAICHRVPQARFWPVDIHPSAVESVGRLVAHAGYGAQFGEIALGDAAHYRWPVTGHIGLVEVMQRALEKEPQIAVTANLAAQLKPAGVLVPACVCLKIQLLDQAAEFDLDQGTVGQPAERVRVPVSPFIDLRADNAASLMAGAVVEFDFTDPRGLHLMVSTRIDVYGDHVLGDYDSGLTTPWLAPALGRSAPGLVGRVQLIPGPSPRLEASLR